MVLFPCRVLANRSTSSLLHTNFPHYFGCCGLPRFTVVKPRISFVIDLLQKILGYCSTRQEITINTCEP